MIVGEIQQKRQDEEDKQALVDKFLEEHPLFARKFAYENFSWPCHEDKKLQVSVFKFRASGYRIRLPAHQKFFRRKKA